MEDISELTRFADSSPAVMFQWNNEPGWPVVFVSAGVKKWGYKVGDFLTQKIHYLDIIHPLDKERIVREVDHHLSSGMNEYNQIYRIQCADDSVIWVEDRTWIFRNEKNEVLKINGVVMDITDRVAREEAADIERRKLNEAIIAGNIGFYDYRALTGEVFYSREWTTQLGYPENTFENSYDTWFNLLHPDDREDAVSLLQKFANNPGQIRYRNRFRLRRIDGSYSWIQATGEAERDNEGKLLRLVGAHVDITDRMDEQSALRTALAEKDVLMAEIHHRVKNNLAIISSILQLQLDKISNETQKDIFIDTITKVKAIALIHESLYINNELELIPLEVYIPNVIEAIRDSFETNDINIQIECTIPPCFVDLNTAIPAGLLINEALTNAYKHAFKGRDRGRIRLQVKNESPDAGIYISDDGIGFPKEQLRRPDSLGMQIMEGLAAQIGGKLQISSESGTKVSVGLDSSLFSISNS